VYGDYVTVWPCLLAHFTTATGMLFTLRNFEIILIHENKYYRRRMRPKTGMCATIPKSIFCLPLINCFDQFLFWRVKNKLRLRNTIF